MKILLIFVISEWIETHRAHYEGIEHKKFLRYGCDRYEFVLIFISFEIQYKIGFLNAFCIDSFYRQWLILKIRQNTSCYETSHWPMNEL